MSTTQILIMIVSGLAVFIGGFICGSIVQVNRLQDQYLKIHELQRRTEEKLKHVEAVAEALEKARIANEK